MSQKIDDKARIIFEHSNQFPEHIDHSSSNSVLEEKHCVVFYHKYLDTPSGHTTLKQRRFHRRCFNVVCLLGP